MTKPRDIFYTISMLEVGAGRDAIEIGNIGKARACARKGCFFAINYWLEDHPDKDWGTTAISMLNKLQEDYSIPENIRAAAYRLTKRVDQNFETGFEEDPVTDGEMIVEYFLDPRQLNE